MADTAAETVAWVRHVLDTSDDMDDIHDLREAVEAALAGECPEHYADHVSCAGCWAVRERPTTPECGPHRAPEGPCEDIGQCNTCKRPTFAMRPPGECYGHHAPDCSLPERHERGCVGGGNGHPTKVLRGWPEFTWPSTPPTQPR